MLQVFDEPDGDGGEDEDEDEVEDDDEAVEAVDEAEAVAFIEDVTAIASSSVEFASNARPGMGQPVGTSKPEVGLSGQTIFPPSMIGVPQQ